MKYLIKNIADSRHDVFYDILKHGVLFDEKKDLVLKIAETDQPFLRSPDSDLILNESIREQLIQADPHLASTFRPIDRVEFYFVDYDAPPAKLDRIVTRDDLDIVIWKKLPRSKRTPEQPVYRFKPPVLTYPLKQSFSDLVGLKVQLPKVHKDKPYFQEKEVSWSSSWRDQRSCCWVDGGYFLRDDLFEILAEHLDDSDWSIFDL